MDLDDLLDEAEGCLGNNFG